VRTKIAIAVAAFILLIGIVAVALNGDDDTNEIETDGSTTTTEVDETTTTAGDGSSTTTTVESDSTTTVVTDGTSPSTGTTEAESTTTTEVPTDETTTTTEVEAEPISDGGGGGELASFNEPAPLPLAPDCSAWSTQSEAQEWMDANGANHDTSNIDTDADGRPCTVALAPPTTAPAPSPDAPTYTPPAYSSGACWDCLAQCESGGNWSINSGNGFSGGLQFHHQTWVGFGGLAYAPEAWMASREGQIAIAEKVLASQGRGAWPGCTSIGAW